MNIALSKKGQTKKKEHILYDSPIQSKKKKNH